jgi:3-keto-disaccharide hydrolase
MPSAGRLWIRPVVVVVASLVILGVAALIQPDLSEEFMKMRSDDDRIMLSEDFGGHRTGLAWRDGRRYRHWRAVYDGYGTTTISTENGRRLTMSPKSPAEPRDTHAGLVTTTKQFADIDLTAQMLTVRQLRPGQANAWEVAWLLWHYSDDHHFYSLVLKPHGWELGKEDPAYPGSQRFLATGETPAFPIGTQHTVHIRQVANSIAVWANGQLLTTYTDQERPYVRGRIGLYTEDAEVAFDSVVVRRP